MTSGTARDEHGTGADPLAQRPVEWRRAWKALRTLIADAYRQINLPIGTQLLSSGKRIDASNSSHIDRAIFQRIDDIAGSDGVAALQEGGHTCNMRGGGRGAEKTPGTSPGPGNSHTMNACNIRLLADL